MMLSHVSVQYCTEKCENIITARGVFILVHNFMGVPQMALP